MVNKGRTVTLPSEDQILTEPLKVKAQKIDGFKSQKKVEEEKRKNSHLQNQWPFRFLWTDENQT